MKITTWNLMRPTSGTATRNKTFLDLIKKDNADILILTEANAIISPGNEYSSISTQDLPKVMLVDGNEIKYSEGEKRVIIYSKYPLGKKFDTYDEYTSVCSEVLTPYGSLLIYGSIIGLLGGKGEQFKTEFEKQKEDIKRLACDNNLVVAGDFNISFSGHPYPSHKVITDANDFFDSVGLDILTRNNLDKPDHIAISRSFCDNIAIEHSQIDFEDKKLTDHSLVGVKLLFESL